MYEGKIKKKKVLRGRNCRSEGEKEKIIIVTVLC